MNPYPDFIERPDDATFIRDQAKSVHDSGKSRVLLLLGPGGVGKTTLVRHLARDKTPGFVWLKPLDIDDIEYWLLSNLERWVADQLDRGNHFFSPYRKHLSRLPRVERPRMGHETVLAHLRRGRDIFLQCYQEFLKHRVVTPVITLDTVEAIRNTDMVVGLTQWMKRLPGTLFILAGRPENPARPDPIIKELTDPHQSLSFETRIINAFNWKQAIDFLQQSQIAPDLGSGVAEKLALLTRGHPLWLALAVSHLAAEGTPPEVSKQSLTELRQLMPFHKASTPKGDKLHDRFVGRLLLRYRDDNFWSEATQRLAVARWRVDKVTWEALMEDYALPENVHWENAWTRFTSDPWIRMRSNRRFVTLHDALAEELVRRTIPLRDKDEEWRQNIWTRMANWQALKIEEQEKNLAGQRDRLDRDLSQESASDGSNSLVERSVELDKALRELDQLRAAQLNYAMLSDYKMGTERFLELEALATKNHEFRLRELLWMVIQPLLTETDPSGPLKEYVKPISDSLGKWLVGHPGLDYELGWRHARHLIDMGQPAEAFAGLEATLKKHQDNLEHAYHLCVLRGNAGIRIKGRVAAAEADLLKALRLAEETPELHARKAEAHKELGFYYRNVGKWGQAHDSYSEALELVPANDQAQKASIQTNWAYVQALRGRYGEALTLVKTALRIRRRADLRREEAMTLSVLSEVHRYGRQFGESWAANLEAEGIFAELGDWPWLGLIAQQKAICLFQVVKADELRSNELKSNDEMLDQAERLAREALDICRDYSARAYPSALNRAGRIVAHRDPDAGLALLAEGVREAEQIADGWFWFANLIEYVELNYWTWQAYPDQEAKYRANIEMRREEIEAAKQEYDFKDLEGRWELLQGHMKLNDGALTMPGQQAELYDEALEHFKRGFAYLVRGYVGSHGAYAVPGEFERLEQALRRRLPKEIIDRWNDEMKAAWSDPRLGYLDTKERTGSLLANLNDMYDSLTQDVSSNSSSRGD